MRSIGLEYRLLVVALWGKRRKTGEEIEGLGCRKHWKVLCWRLEIQPIVSRFRIFVSVSFVASTVQ